jgi:ankyrin repeat protein
MTVTAFAAFSAPLPTLKLLIKAGGQVKETDAIAQAVLGHKDGFPHRVAVIQYLIDIGAPLDIYTPMYNGVKESEGQLASIVSLFGQETALQKAVRVRSPDMVKLLVKNGANVAIRGGYANSSVSKGEIALEIAEILGYNDIQKLLVDN